MVPQHAAVSFVLICVLQNLCQGQECVSLNNKEVKCENWEHFPTFGPQHLNAHLLNLSRNALRSISSRAFSRHALKWIDLSHNKMTAINREAFPSDQQLKQSAAIGGVYLHGNPWDCTCNLQWLVDALQTGMLKSLGKSAECATPELLRGKALMELARHEYCFNPECAHCDDAARCVKKPNRHECVCRPNYKGNGIFCAGILSPPSQALTLYHCVIVMSVDIDECADKSTHDCKKNEICENFAGGFECICPDGFTVTEGVCKDVDECKPPPVGCGPALGMCLNTIGSYKCNCHAGLKFVIGRGCVDVDECKGPDDPCVDIPNSKCINKAIKHHGDPGYLCKCNEGYMQVGEACVLMGDSTKMYILVGAGSGIFTICVIIIVLIAVLCRRHSKQKEEKALTMAPMAMAAPMDYAYMDLPQTPEGGEEEDAEWGGGEDVDDMDDF
ncbi:epidermal growth factor-like protein 6 isoform X3 [Nematostella vectensis]|uniref:epidermal growth factor-like protein 6 isoform X3 n=1 Tax=Nematostella vectensis TaxID=45351 RepID=UPI00207761BC|nr:epidermal growth factor-like protein 6 isoform X3 [Nematostella vectensis]